MILILNWSNFIFEKVRCKHFVGSKLHSSANFSTFMDFKDPIIKEETSLIGQVDFFSTECFKSTCYDFMKGMPHFTERREIDNRGFFCNTTRVFITHFNNFPNLLNLFYQFLHCGRTRSFDRRRRIFEIIPSVSSFFVIRNNTFCCKTLYL